MASALAAAVAVSEATVTHAAEVAASPDSDADCDAETALPLDTVESADRYAATTCVAMHSAEATHVPYAVTDSA